MAEIVDGRPNTEQKLTAEPAAIPLTPSATTTPVVERTNDVVVAEEPAFRLPPLTAIAGVLIRDWVDGKIAFPREEIPVGIQKGNL